jgi:hypothetical protein
MNLLGDPFWMSAFPNAAALPASIDIIVSVAGRHFPANKNVLASQVQLKIFR